jgi:hypothetical protein
VEKTFRICFDIFFTTHGQTAVHVCVWDISLFSGNVGVCIGYTERIFVLSKSMSVGALTALATR